MHAACMLLLLLSGATNSAVTIAAPNIASDSHIYTIDPILCRPKAQHTHTPFTNSKQQQVKEEGQIRHYSRPSSDDSDPYSALSLQKIV